MLNSCAPGALTSEGDRSTAAVRTQLPHEKVKEEKGRNGE